MMYNYKLKRMLHIEKKKINPLEAKPKMFRGDN